MLQQTSERLASAENALRFYANPKSYTYNRDPHEPGLVFQNKLIDDFETAANSANTYIAGKRAREHFKTYETD
jgi:hypothetical protein